MKNLIIYISPTRATSDKHYHLTSNQAGQLTKVQIENSLALGWREKDIMLVTNFDFKYGKIEAISLKDIEFFEKKPKTTKIHVILKLFEQMLIKENQLYWFHALDTFQLESFTETEFDLKNADLALTEVGKINSNGTNKLSTDSIFFKSTAKDIFSNIQEISNKQEIDDEESLVEIIKRVPKIKKRIKIINNSYNFTGYNLQTSYQNAIKPLKIVHFNPFLENPKLKTTNPLGFFKGNNPINTPLITNKLIKIFAYHRIREATSIAKKKDVAILIPTYKRAHKILFNYKNAKESSPLVTNVYFIVEKDDQESIDVLKTSKLPYFLNERTKNPAGALNTAFYKTTEQYFYTGSDDFDYKPGWLEKCLELMVGPVKVVGTNDLHNRDVQRGRYATGFLVDRDYIKERSGTFDGESLILSEAYLHNFPDREFAEIAQLRGVYAHCLEAIVEHLHWSFGLSPKDETYTMHDGTRNRDHHLYNSRKPIWTQKIQNEQKNMKNLLIYTGPNKNFQEEDEILARIQIDNSLDLGWKKEDILLITDFPFNYNGVKSQIVPNGLYYDFDKMANKSKVLAYLLHQKTIKPNVLYWCHDFDAYENFKIEKEELGLSNFDIGLVHYFYKPEWSFTSVFLKDSAIDIINLLDQTISNKPYSSRNNEKTLTKLIKNNKIQASRYKMLNVTYNITKRFLPIVYKEAIKPLKVLHFRPSNKDELMPDTALNMFMYGKNSLKMPLMSERLVKIFKHHGIK